MLCDVYITITAILAIE